MEESEIMLDVVCYSEKEEVSLGFGFCISEEERENKRIDEFGDIATGISDSYYELYFEFEPGINKAKKLIEERHCSSIDDALREVFGHFELSFSIDGVDEEFEYDFDVDECVFRLLVENNTFEET